MVEVLREIQLPLLSLVLLLAAIGKGASRPEHHTGPMGGRTSASGRNAVYVQSGVEAVLAGTLLLASGWFGAAVTFGVGIYFCGAVLALLVRRARDPLGGCGCFGDLSSGPVGTRMIVRAALLAVAAIAATGVGVSGMDVVRHMTGQHWTVFAGALLVVVLLSPEVPEAVRRLALRDSCTVREVPLARTIARLRTSDVWRANAGFVGDRSPAEVWRYGCWRMLRFRGRREGTDTDLVFAVSLKRRSTAVHAVFADPETGTTLAAFGEVPAPQRSRARKPTAMPDSTERTVRFLMDSVDGANGTAERPRTVLAPMSPPRSAEH
ncbi:hypothetical protein J4H86_16810 [Spiractinospora alimapuensis]|uniref:MauE/DoxX family redox-associated membrane protein n=1 Tax=Spiractinospora alimapuensis TaxID=2820884 RepID=UPI001F44AA5E|nr:MauE/DoxX family redox-associated membrane protein [Spiractinospora alimapuensis]QVQ50556.1 hypothetical protein J4H86_16810 [Spiractinospora alimapuensis]